jgi:hypothetical protein
MTTDFTRRELAKLAGTGAVVIAAPAIGRSTSAADLRVGNAMVAQAATGAGEKGKATNPSSDIAMQRADELLRQMTIEEKAMQLSCIVPIAVLGADGPMRSQLDALLGQGIGHIAGPGLIGHKMPETLAKSVNAIQRYLVTETRLKIPALVHNEALNGVVSPGFTAFPTAIGLAATWDPAAVQEMADIMRRQMRAVGMLHALAPVMDVARDARWGRVTETYGEDPYLVSAMSVAFTRGMQGKDLRDGVLVCAKHFLGYAVTDAGQNMAATAVGPRELYDVYARPFEAAIRLAGLSGVMASYSEFEGMPIHVSRAVLRICCAGEWVSPGRSSPTTTAWGGRRRGNWLPPRPRTSGRSPWRPAWTSSCRGSMDTGRCWPRPCRAARFPSLSWTSRCAACCATSSSSACSRSRTSAKIRSRSARWRLRALISPAGSPPSR